MISIDISKEVWDEIAKRGKFGETADDVLRRVFELDPTVKQDRMRSHSGVQLPPDGTKCKMVFKGNRFDGYIDGNSVVVENLGTGTSLSNASYIVTHTYRNGWRDWWFLLPGATDWIHADQWRKDNLFERLFKDKE